MTRYLSIKFVMKKPDKIICSLFFLFFLPLSIAFGQDKKNEQKIRIVVDDGSGTKTVIDTVFIDHSGPDSLILSDGSVVYLRHSRNEPGLEHHRDKDNVFITYSGNGDKGKDYKEITVISTDSTADNAGERRNVHFFRKTEAFSSDDDSSSVSDKTRFVIAKDGMVVTVEGNDEAKTMELAKEIESKLGIKNNETGEKATPEPKKKPKK